MKLKLQYQTNISPAPIPSGMSPKPSTSLPCPPSSDSQPARSHGTGSAMGELAGVCLLSAPPVTPPGRGRPAPSSALTARWHAAAPRPKPLRCLYGRPSSQPPGRPADRPEPGGGGAEGAGDSVRNGPGAWPRTLGSGK